MHRLASAVSIRGPLGTSFASNLARAITLTRLIGQRHSDLCIGHSLNFF